jgi:hypothetical protein
MPDNNNPAVEGNGARGERLTEALEQECEQLRQSLAAMKAERDQYRQMVFSVVRQKMTTEEKNELERRAREALESGGQSLEALLDELEQSHDA